MFFVKKGIFHILRKVRVLRRRFQHRRLHSEFRKKKGYQKNNFNSLLNEFLDNFNKINPNIDQYVTQTWDNYQAKFEKFLLPHPQFSFLRNPVIMDAMVTTAGGKMMREELSFLEREIPRNKLITYLEEDYVGDPLIFNSTYLTSHNTIRHLYHIFKFAKTTQADLNKINTIVEWGGGYGNLARIFQRLKNASPTYVIIDIPLMSCLQWLYLSSILGKENVHLLMNKDDIFQDGKINLLPVSLLEHFDVKADLFISTWALSESSVFSQNYVFSHQYFGAKRLLLTTGNDALSDRLRKQAEKDGAIIEDVEFSRGSHYAFR